MKASDIPTKFPIPFAEDAGGTFIRNIPVTPGSDAAAASLQQGFPPLNFEPISAGGVPPSGKDFNGIHFQETATLRWLAAGGGVYYFDVDFAAAIGGYPQGAFLQATSGPGAFWISTINDNVNNPDTGGSGWLAFPGASIKTPSFIQKTNTTINFDCQTQFSAGLLRSAPAAMVANLAATGILAINQEFEVADLSGNLSQGKVTVVPPAATGPIPNGHLIAGATNFIMTNNRQKCQFKYYGVDGGTGYWDVFIGG